MDSLCPTAKFLYGVIGSLDGEEGCYASNAYLSATLGISDRQIRVLLGELEVLGLIVRVDDAGKRIIHTVEQVALSKGLQGSIVQGGGSKVPRGRKKTSVGGGRKLPPYNKEDNKEDKDTVASDSVPVQEQAWIIKAPFGSDGFLNAWKSWVVYRKEIKKKLTDSSVREQFKDFVLWGEDKSIYSIQQSIKQGWQGLFEPQKSIGVMKSNTKPLTAKDHETF